MPAAAVKMWKKMEFDLDSIVDIIESMEEGLLDSFSINDKRRLL